MTNLRAARSTDAGKVGSILTEFASEMAWLPKLHTGAEDIAHAGIMIDRGWVTVAEVSEQLVGFSASSGRNVDALYVAATARRQGVGSALLDQLKTQAHQLELWTFQANAPAQAFYLKHGFSEVTRTDGSGNEENLPDIKFAWVRKGNA